MPAGWGFKEKIRARHRKDRDLGGKISTVVLSIMKKTDFPPTLYQTDVAKYI